MVWITLFSVWVGLILSMILLSGSASAQIEPFIVINEIQYHPLSGDYGEEYIELYNAGSTPVDLSGWRFSDGITYLFPPSTIISPGGYLVVGYDPATIEARYGISGVMGPFLAGRLSNSGERLAIEDAAGVLMDEVTYDDHYPWPELPDGKGPSLELINPMFDNSQPCSWSHSIPAESSLGTPGAQNSVYSLDNIPPCIYNVVHRPSFPPSTQPVTVTALVSDNGDIVTTTLHYRPEGASGYTSVPMVDDGIGADSVPGDWIHTAVIPPHSVGLYVEFYITAVDAEGAERIVPDGAPASVSDETGRPLTISYLYLVENDPPVNDLPIYRLILTHENWTELTNRDLFSNVLLDGTFVYSDEVFYNVGVRYRGESSRNVWPRPYRIKFRDEHEFQDRERMNLVSHELGRQALSHDLFQRAGLPAPDTRFVTFYVNKNREGDYLDIEQVDNDFLQVHFPESDWGNLYRGVDGADLRYRGPNPDSYRLYYLKKNNQHVDDYSDVIALTEALTNSSNETFRREAELEADMEQWLRWFAIQAVLDNHEGALWIGQGDDYFLYNNPSDDRFLLISWDHDSTFRNPHHGIWEPNWYAGDIVKRILNYPDYTRWYYQHIAAIAADQFSVATMYPLIDALPAVVSADRRNYFKWFVAERIPTLQSEIPNTTLSISTNGGADFTVTQPQVTLEGNCSPLRDVYVNGEGGLQTLPLRVQYPTATTWRYTSTLTARDNPFVITDGLHSRTIMVYWDFFHGGVLEEDVTLPGSAQPYLITENIIVPAGVTLTIEPGATLQFYPDRYLRVNEGGRLLAQGMEEQPIRFTRWADTYWGGILFHRTQEDNLIQHAVVEYTREVIHDPWTQCISAHGARLTIADSLIRHTYGGAGYSESTSGVQVFSSEGVGSTLYLLRNEITDVQGDAVQVTASYAHIQGNYIHDIRRGEYACEGIALHSTVTPALVLDNIIHDVSDDCLDLNSAAAIIERNQLYHCGDKGISAGTSLQVQIPSAVTVTNNLIYTCLGKDSDPFSGSGIAVKDGTHAHIVNNTISDCRHGIYLYRGEWTAGGTATVVNTILWGNRSALDLDALSTVTVTYSDVQMEAGVWPGAGNINADPLFRAPEDGDYRIQEGSPCVDTGSADSAPDEDIEGVYRPQGWAPDQGAYELPVGLAITTNGGANFATPDQVVTLEGTRTYSRAVDVSSVGGEGGGVVYPTGTTWRYTHTLWTRDNQFVVTETGGLESHAITVYWDFFRGGVLTDDLTLPGSAYPYRISADILVPVGVTLTVEPSATLQFAPSRSMIVEGRLWAVGARSRPVVFTRATTGTWGTILFRHTLADNRIAYATIEHAGWAVSSTFTSSFHPGVAVLSSTLSLDHSRARHLDGAALLVEGGSAYLVNNLIYTNTNGVVVAAGGVVRVVNNTISDQRERGLWLRDGGAATVVNTILWENGEDLAVAPSSTVTVTHSNVYSRTAAGTVIWPGVGNVAADPLFRSPARSDYRLQEESPCVDAGTPDGAPAFDIQGIYRPHGAGYDVGAYEFFEYFSCYLPLVLRSP